MRRQASTSVLGVTGVALANAPTPEVWPRAPNALAPRGPYAERIAELWWFLLIAASVVFVIVMALFLIGLFRQGREVTDGSETHDRRVIPLLIGGVVVTVLVLIATSVYTLLTMAALAAPEEEPEHVFEVVGKRWWWEVRYNGEVIGANELHLPVGEPVRVRLLSDNVIHSFWVPELAGKRDLIPGNPNEIWLQADEAGVYRGECAEYCGLQHAHMAFLVVAEPQGDFESWLQRALEPATEPITGTQRAGQAVFTREGCAGCHTVRGTGARGELGPDLTHLASRLSLGAGTLPNTKGHLAGWVVNPWAVKPGVHMPPQDLSGDDLHALLDYLQGLE
jgi:cytochrome c oxidase subunit 2